MRVMCMGALRDFDAERLRYEARERAIYAAIDSLDRDEIYNTCARYELESDEFMTREEKALTIIRARER